MIRKLFAVTILAVATAAATAAPAPAIDFICSCTLCTPTSGLGCRDLHRPGPTGFTSCSAYYAKYC